MKAYMAVEYDLTKKKLYDIAYFDKAQEALDWIDFRTIGEVIIHKEDGYIIYTNSLRGSTMTLEVKAT